MKQKPISEAERREQLELDALEKRAKQQEREHQAEQKARQLAESAYSGIWRQFSENLKKGKAYANRELLADLTAGASFFVPLIMTAKEHTGLIMELADKMTGEDSTRGETPMEMMANWISGKIDLSRIPLERTERVN